MAGVLRKPEGVRFEEVSKVFSDGTRAVDHLDLEIAPGEFMVLVGPSGCGKTTALRMVAGLETITAGAIRIGGRIVNDLEPRERDIAMVFQNYALYPHMTVRDNMRFGLRMRRIPRSDARQRVESMAGVLGLNSLLERRPGALSGGQRQRVAMGRAIVREPQVFLMDEPLSNLDAKLRVQMRAEITRLQRDQNATTLYVTHDQVEAMTMGDRVAVMRHGRAQQTGPPQEIYDEPANLFVATFMGSPAMNVVEATVESSPDGLAIALEAQRIHLGSEVEARCAGLRSYVGQRVAVGLRPEALRPIDDQSSAQLRGRVVTVEPLGSEVLVHVEIAAVAVISEELAELIGDREHSVVLGLDAKDDAPRSILVCRFAAGAPARVGEEMVVAVDRSKLHFFDLQSENRISR